MKASCVSRDDNGNHDSLPDTTVSRADVARVAALASLYSFPLTTSNRFVSPCVVCRTRVAIALAAACTERRTGLFWFLQASPSSVPPKVLEPVWRHIGVPDGVLNVLVAKVVLQGPRIVAIVRQLEPAGMAKHVRVDREWHLGGLPEALDEAVETDGADWSAALGNEYVGLLRVLATQLTQCPHLVTADRVHAGN